MEEGPIPLSESLAGVVRALRGPGGRADQPAPAVVGGVFGRWNDAVGEAIAAHVQPVRLDGTRLLVEVDDPAWATQVQFFAQTICQRLAEVAGATVEHLEARVAGRRH